MDEDTRAKPEEFVIPEMDSKWVLTYKLPIVKVRDLLHGAAVEYMNEDDIRKLHAECSGILDAAISRWQRRTIG